MSRIFLLRSIVVFCCMPLVCQIAAQDPVSTDVLKNAQFEKAADNRTPEGWFFNSASGGKVSVDTKEKFAGESSALIDATVSDPEARSVFSNLMQSIDGKPWRGKTVRFRAAVRTEQLDSAAKAQLWFRVDRAKDANGKVQYGAFDNMRDRPIRNDQWKHYEITLKIDDDAERIVIGMFLIGVGKAWIDDASFVEVDKNTPTTDAKPAGSKNKSSKKSSSRASRFRMPEAVMRALGEAEHAPQQPFWTHWLWLPLIAVVLFVLSTIPPRETEVMLKGEEKETRWVSGHVAKFAFRFSFAYWLLYCLPSPFSRLIPYLGNKLAAWHQQGLKPIVAWTAESVFKIETELVPPNGSGDTTFSYINVFIVFVLALAIAIIWTASDWRKTDYRWMKDLLRSYLRYVLALAMLGYGLAKVAWDSNQFPTIGEFQLDKKWGDSSPMNVVWSFMGASRSYTVFAGLGEVIGGVLLIFRRTTTIGAMVVVGVMANVVMLNYCYDIPVKLYSSHLLMMAFYLLLPEVRRLGNVLFLNRPTKTVEFRPPYTNEITIWIQRVFKVALIVIGFGIPLFSHTTRQFKHFSDQRQQPELFGNYDVTQFKLNGKIIKEVGEIPAWKSVKFESQPYNMDMERKKSNWMSVRVLSRGNAAATFEQFDNEIILDDHQYNFLPNSPIKMTKISDDQYELAGTVAAGKIEVSITRKTGKKSRLTGRGFRWINEVPFNR